MHDAIDKFKPYTTSDAPKAIDDCGLGADLAAHMRANPPDICDGNGDLPIGVPFYEKPFVAGLVNACSTVVALRRHLAWNYRGQPPVVYVGCDTGTATAMAMATGVACVRARQRRQPDRSVAVRQGAARRRRRRRRRRQRRHQRPSNRAAADSRQALLHRQIVRRRRQQAVRRHDAVVCQRIWATSRSNPISINIVFARQI